MDGELKTFGRCPEGDESEDGPEDVEDERGGEEGMTEAGRERMDGIIDVEGSIEDRGLYASYETQLFSFY